MNAAAILPTLNDKIMDDILFPEDEFALQYHIHKVNTPILQGHYAMIFKYMPEGEKALDH